jgi:hypothetical protein
MEGIKMWKQWLKDALLRAIRTFAQTAVSMIAVGAAFSEIDWLRVLSVSGVAFVLSILTSLATGLPETEMAARLKQQPPDDD